VSALMGVHNFRAKWIGWPGVCLTASSYTGFSTVSVGCNVAEVQHLQPLLFNAQLLGS
jgi:hypothetical protein